MDIRAVLFDLDGTLADTALDLGGALNDLLRERGLPEKDLSVIRPYVGHGSAVLIGLGAGVMPEDDDFLSWQQRYLAIYEQRSAQDTVLFPYVNEVLLELSRLGIRWGIVTNKHRRFTEKLLPCLPFSVPPDVVVYGDTCVESKPSPMPLLYACEQLGVLPEHCVYVGDAQRDVMAGKNAGMMTVLASWGYLSVADDYHTWGADKIARDMRDVLSIIIN